MGSIKKTARLTGVLILLIALLAPFSMVYVPSTLLIPGDASLTASNIKGSEGLLRLAMASDALVFLMEVWVVGLLYTLLKPVNQTLALIATLARLAMVVVQGINLLNYFLVLLLLGDTTYSYSTLIASDQLHAFALLFLNAHASVIFIWGLFFGLHLLVSGYLVYQSGYIAKGIGILLIVVGVCYLIQSFGNILLPQYKDLFAAAGYLASIEIVFPLWLLIKGVNHQQWENRTALNTALA